MDAVGVVLRDGDGRTGGSIDSDGRKLIFDHGDGRQVMDLRSLHLRPVRGMMAYLTVGTIVILLISYRSLDVSLALGVASAATIVYYGTWIAMGRSTWDAVAHGTVGGHDATWRMQGLTRDNQQKLGRMVREMRRG